MFFQWSTIEGIHFRNDSSKSSLIAALLVETLEQPSYMNLHLHC